MLGVRGLSGSSLALSLVLVLVRFGSVWFGLVWWLWCLRRPILMTPRHSFRPFQTGHPRNVFGVGYSPPFVRGSGMERA